MTSRNETARWLGFAIETGEGGSLVGAGRREGFEANAGDSVAGRGETSSLVGDRRTIAGAAAACRGGAVAGARTLFSAGAARSLVDLCDEVRGAAMGSRSRACATS